MAAALGVVDGQLLGMLNVFPEEMEDTEDDSQVRKHHEPAARS